MRKRRLTSQDVPGVLEVLAGSDEDAQCEALTRLCPCRNRRYDREVWLAIPRAYSQGARLLGEGPLRRQVGTGEAAFGACLVDLHGTALLAGQRRGQREAKDRVLEEDLAALVPGVDAVVRELQEGRHPARAPHQDQI